MKEVDKAYLAGLVDCDGCINISKHKQSRGNTYGYQVRVYICNTGEKALKQVAKDFGGKFYKRRKTKDTHNIVCQVYWYAGNCIKLLENIMPYMRIKKFQANFVLKGWPRNGEINPNKREYCWKKLKEMHSWKY